MKTFIVSVLFAITALVGFIYTSSTTIHASAQPPSSERVDLANTAKVRVFSTTKEGEWTSRLGLVNVFSDATIIACFEWPTSTLVSCLVVTESDETLLVPVRLKELKT